MITRSGTNWFVVDSSGWVEYMGGGARADLFAPFLESIEKVILPSIIVYEVHKKLSREQGKSMADIFLSQAFGFGERLIQLSLELSIVASRTSLQTGLPMADAIIYATAGKYQAQLITSDSHFASLDGVTLL